MADSSPFGATPVVTLNGQTLPGWATPLLEKLVVDDHIHLPDVATLSFRDTAGDVITRLGITLGASLKITANQAGGAAQEPLLDGEITALEHEYGPHGSVAVVVVYDLSHRMCRGQHTRAWRDVTDASIASALASEHGLTADVESTSPNHKHVSQLNMSDWDFLRCRAQETGYEIAVSGKTLHWRKPSDHSEAPPPGDASANNPRLQLVAGTNLVRFRPRLTSAGQVSTIEARGWDPQQKRSLVHEVKADTTSAAVGIKHAAVLSSLTAQGTFHVVDQALAAQADVENAAKAMSEVVSSAFVEATGEAHGDPRLVAGAAVSISMAGSPHDGTYTLTSTRHVYDHAGYRTTFVCSGRHERSLLGLASAGRTKGTHSGGGKPQFGVVIGIVTDIKDDEGLNRVCVSFPWLDDDYVTGWARVAQLGAGDSRGSTFLPEVDDEVLVAFDRGDVRVPYVIGQLYNGKDKPAHADAVDSGSGKVSKRALTSRVGHELLFDEDKGVKLTTGDGNLWLELDASGTTIKVDSAGKVEIHGTDTITIKGDADISITAGTKLALSAPNISVAASAQLDLDGGGAAKLHAGVVQIN